MIDNFRKLYSAAQIRELDRNAIAGGVSGYVLMQRAAQACWRAMQHSRPAAKRIDIVCGSGNNGGDGYEIARLAQAVGRDVRVWQVGEVASSGDAVNAREAWLAGGGTTQTLQRDSLANSEVVIDALFGIGLSRVLTDTALRAVNAINAARAGGAWVLAVDVPSGLGATTGKIWGAAVRADITVTFVGHKLGLYTGAGVDCAGEIQFDALNIPEPVFRAVEPLAELLQEQDLRDWLPPRPRNSHKGSNGHALVLGGDEGMVGAALLAARAALCAGSGLVTLATRSAHAAALAAAQPELMCHGVEAAADLVPLLARATVVAIGPGLGQGAWASRLLAQVLKSELPLVVDADALNLLAREPLRRDNWVLTPHPGEAARLLGREAAGELQNDRPGAAAELQQRYGGVIVLKGAGSLVQGRRLSLCPYGNPGMAVGGMGDVLTGIIAAFVAQGLSLEAAANAGVLAHALAGDRAATEGQRGLLPSDLLAQLRVVVNP
jgi:hydroxyethylthiazole kinase-like uncharacterized protein yjeF